MSDPNRPAVSEHRIHTDATIKGGRCGIGVVRFIEGVVTDVHSREICLENLVAGIHSAECEAIAWAKQLYPLEMIFSDNSSAARDMGVNWIPRKLNNAADKASRAPIGAASRRDKPAKMKKMKKKGNDLLGSPRS